MILFFIFLIFYKLLQILHTRTNCVAKDLNYTKKKKNETKKYLPPKYVLKSKSIPNSERYWWTTNSNSLTTFDGDESFTFL